jgi:hypothetical protein
MPTAWKSELIDLLGTKEHLAPALEIGRVINAVISALWSRFFDNSSAKVRDGLKGFGLSERWQIRLADEARRDQSFGLQWILRPEQDGKLQLVTGLIADKYSQKSFWQQSRFADL